MTTEGTGQTPTSSNETTATGPTACDATELREQADSEQFANGNHQRAIELYQASIDCEPTAWAHLNLGAALAFQDLEDEAEDAYLTALALEPNSVVEYRALGQLAGVYLRQGNYAQSIERASQSIDIAGDQYPTAWVTRAQAYEAVEQWADALADRTKVIEISPPHWFAYYARGLVYLQLGLDSNARADFERSLEIEPGRQEPQIALAALQ